MKQKMVQKITQIFAGKCQQWFQVEIYKKQKREAILLAKKKRLQRQRVGNRPMPKTLKWGKNNHIRKDMIFVKSVLTLINFGRPAKNVGVLCPSKLSCDG